MHRNMPGAFAATGAVLGALVLAAAGAPGAAARASQAGGIFAGRTSHAPAPGSRLWVKRYNGPGNRTDAATSVAVSPDGRKVFVTGQSYGARSHGDYATIAYDAATGHRLWGKRYNGSANGQDAGLSMAVSPTGKTVFVTGYSEEATSSDDYTTIAYNAATGAQRWMQHYNGPANGGDAATSLAVGRSGKLVFVTGQSTGTGSESDYATIAYDATTGARVWVARYNGPAGDVDIATSVAASPTGKTVFVTGYSAIPTGNSQGAVAQDDYTTIAYDATTGARVWLHRYNGPANGDDSPAAMTVSPTGNRLFVTGESEGRSIDFATVGYNATTGAQLWVRRYALDYINQPHAIAASRDGTAVFITGCASGPGHRPRYGQAAAPRKDEVTIAYSAATGARLWLQRYAGPCASVAVSRTGSKVYAAGSTGTGYGVIAFRAATGARVWSARYNGPGNGDDYASSVAASPTSPRVYVTGSSTGVTSREDYATIAYAG